MRSRYDYQPVPSPPQQVPTPRQGQGSPKRRSNNEATVMALRVIAVICRVCAIAASVVVMAATLGLATRLPVLGQIYHLLMVLTPPGVFGILCVATPFGGMFRGDFAVVSVALFVIDWVCLRIAASLR